MQTSAGSPSPAVSNMDMRRPKRVGAFIRCCYLVCLVRGCHLYWPSVRNKNALLQSVHVDAHQGRLDGLRALYDHVSAAGPQDSQDVSTIGRALCHEKLRKRASNPLKQAWKKRPNVSDNFSSSLPSAAMSSMLHNTCSCAGDGRNTPSTWFGRGNPRIGPKGPTSNPQRGDGGPVIKLATRRGIASRYCQEACSRIQPCRTWAWPRERRLEYAKKKIQSELRGSPSVLPEVLAPRLLRLFDADTRSGLTLVLYTILRLALVLQ